jgi:hypothetical protein
MSSTSTQFLEGPEVWSGSQLNDRTDWILHIQPAEIEEIEAMLKAVQGRTDVLTDLGRNDFPMPRIASRFEALRAELEGGRGFALLRGLPVERYTLEEKRTIFWALAVHLGDPQGQDRLGNRMHSVTNTNLRVEENSAVRS